MTNHLRCRNKTNKVKYVLHHVDFPFQASTNELKPKAGVLIHNIFIKNVKKISIWLAHQILAKTYLLNPLIGKIQMKKYKYNFYFIGLIHLQS